MYEIQRHNRNHTRRPDKTFCQSPSSRRPVAALTHLIAFLGHFVRERKYPVSRVWKFLHETRKIQFVDGVGIFMVGLVSAEDSKEKSDKDKKHTKATIAKVDAKKSTVTLTMRESQSRRDRCAFH